MHGKSSQFEGVDVVYNQVEADRNAEFSQQLSRIEVELYGLRHELDIPETESIEFPVSEYNEESLTDVVIVSGESGAVSVVYKTPGDDAEAPIHHVLTYDGSVLMYNREGEKETPVTATLDGIGVARFVCDVCARSARGGVWVGGS